MKQDPSPPDVIADAVVFAISYLSLDEEEFERTEDDIQAVKEIYHRLSRRTFAEHEALLTAARRAVDAESTEVYLGKGYRKILEHCEKPFVAESAPTQQGAVADALIYATAHLSLDEKDDRRADDDCVAVETIYDTLSRCTIADQKALLAATRRAIGSELADAFLGMAYQQILEDFEERFADDRT